MRLKTYSATAMERVRREMGADSLIVSTRGNGEGALVAGADIAPLSFTEVRIIPHVADGPTPIDAISLAHLIMPRFQTTMAPS